MNIDPSPLVGQFLSRGDKTDSSWLFEFSQGDVICTESEWRLVTTEGVHVTSEDHGHRFGLAAPVDALERVRIIIGSDPVIQAIHEANTGDLFVKFADQRYFQFLQLSCGYESWRLFLADREFICLGGGQYASRRRYKG